MTYYNGQLFRSLIRYPALPIDLKQKLGGTKKKCIGPDQVTKPVLELNQLPLDFVQKTMSNQKIKSKEN